MKFLFPINGLFIASAFALSACQVLQDSAPAPSYKRIAWEHAQPGCKGAQCPLLNVDSLHYRNEPVLNAEIERRLLQLADPEQELPHADSLLAYERSFLPAAQPGWASYVQAKQRDRHGSILVIELSSYLDRRGAHGAPGRGFINYDLKEDRLLSLEDLLLPGQADALWKLAEQAHADWLKRNQLDQDAQYLALWPFKPTPHVALLKEHLLLKYDVYAIAPYSSGHPEFAIDYGQLKGIIKPQYRP